MSTTEPENPELLDTCEEFLRTYYQQDILTLAEHYPSDSTSIRVDWMDLFQFDPELAQDYIEHPNDIQSFLDGALSQVPIPVDIDLSDAHVRVVNVNGSESLHVGEQRAEHIGEYHAITGQVAKTTGVVPQADELAYQCVRCGSYTPVPQYTDQQQEPNECAGCERSGPFKIDYGRSILVDYQQIRLQQPPEEAKGGQGNTIDAELRGDLVATVDAGDRVTVNGTFDVRDDSDDRTFRPYVDAGGVEIEETDFEEIEIGPYEDEIEAIADGEHGDPYELLVESLAPKIRGYDTIKRAIIFQLFGGNRVEYPDGSVDRGDSHILLLGDPGTAKSSLLRAVEELAPRSVYASGKGLTAAGATAAAVPDDFGDTKWSLEAGAMVLANKGVACIDEIDKVDESAVSSLHSALEDQRVEVNKADINATLPAKTSLLAAGNPVDGRFTQFNSIPEQIDLGPALLSRFDLMYMVGDSPDAEKDQDIAEHMLDSRQVAARYSDDKRSVGDGELERIQPAIEPDVLRAYIAYARRRVTPTFDSESVKDSLIDFFTGLRNANHSDKEDDPVPVTFRKLEAIQRLAEASARVRLSDEITLSDVERATDLVTESMRQVGYDEEEGTFDADIIETGSSMSQKKRLERLQELIREVQADSNRSPPAADLSTLYNRVEDENDLTEKFARNAVDNWKNSGDLYAPEDGFVRWV